MLEESQVAINSQASNKDKIAKSAIEETKDY